MRASLGILALCLLGTTAGCGDSSTGPQPPTPGTFDVLISLPNAHDQALLVTLGGQVSDFAPAPGFEHYLNASAASTTLLLVAAAPLTAGETLAGSFTVPDIATYTNRSAVITEAAASDHQLRGDLAGYVVRLQQR